MASNAPGEKISPSVIAKLKAGEDHVPIDSPEALPFLMALEDFLRRWYGVGLEEVERFYNVALSRSGENVGSIECIVTSPPPGKPEKVAWEWWVGFDHFSLDGVFCVDLAPEAMDASPCMRRWEEENEKHGREMDLGFDVIREDGEIREKIYVREDR